jgi:peptidoglycan/xylan/chitin deacetylase (PgdA/CDA1 family)
MVDSGWEVASHGYRWIDYQNVNEDLEREHIERAVEIHSKLLGKRPVGMYQGKPNAVHTRKLVVEEGGFLYDSDSYADDLPYWNMEHGKPHLVIPYTLSENDMRFVSPNGFSHGGDFSKYLKDSLKYLIEEGRAGSPKMMSVGLHCRLVGRPGRAAGLAEFIDYAKSFGKDVWICTREDIAKHWYDKYYPLGEGKSIEEDMQASERSKEQADVDKKRFSYYSADQQSHEEEENGDVI